MRVDGGVSESCVGADPYWPHQAPAARCTPLSGQTNRTAAAHLLHSAASPACPQTASGLLTERERQRDTLPHIHSDFRLYYLIFHWFSPKTIEIQRRFTSMFMNGRNCNAQYGRIVPPSKWKSQSLIGKVIASQQRPLEAKVPIEPVNRLSLKGTCTLSAMCYFRLCSHCQCLFWSCQRLFYIIIKRSKPCFPSNTIKPLQMIQNAAARLVFNEPKRAHVTPLFISLHWLPVAARIKFKTLMLAYRTTTGSAPSYFHSLLRIYIPSRSLRSASERRLVVPSQRGSKSLSRTFSFTIPGWWNNLPTPIRNAGSLSIFKQQLKTHLFRHYLTSS